MERVVPIPCSRPLLNANYENEPCSSLANVQKKIKKGLTLVRLVLIRFTFKNPNQEYLKN